MAFNLKINPYTMGELAKGIDVIGKHTAPKKTTTEDLYSSMKLLADLQEAMKFRQTMADNKRKNDAAEEEADRKLKKELEEEELDKALRERDAATLAELNKRLYPGREAVTEASRRVPAYAASVDEGTGATKLRFAFNPENPEVKRRVVDEGEAPGDMAASPIAPTLRLRLKAGDLKGAMESLEKEDVRTAERKEYTLKKDIDFEAWKKQAGIERQWKLADFAKQEAIRNAYHRGDMQLANQYALDLKTTAPATVAFDKEGQPVVVGGKGPTRADRNNNPLNIKASGMTKAFAGVTGVEGKPAADGGNFLIFDNPQAGFAAGRELWRKGRAYQGVTVAQALKAWSGGGYGADVAKAAGLNPEADAQSLTDAQWQKLAQAMARREGWSGGKKLSGGRGATGAGKKTGWAALTQLQQMAKRREARELAAFVRAAGVAFSRPKVEDSASVNGETVKRSDLEKARGRLNDLYEAFPELKAMSGKTAKTAKGIARGDAGRL